MRYETKTMPDQRFMKTFQALHLTIDVRDAATPVLGFLSSGLADRTGVNGAIGREALTLTRRHLTRISLERHDSSAKLDAAPSGFWAPAADNATMVATSGAATVSVSHPGISRALHDITILPGGGTEWLAIPIVAEAYQMRAGQFEGLFFSHPKGTDHALLGRREGAGAPATFLYLLVKSVLLPQDRTLLPMDEAFVDAAHSGVAKYVRALLSLGEEEGAQ